MIDKNLLGQKIKELRSESNYTQQNIADFLGVDQSFISKVEKNERVLTSDMLEKLAVLFGVKLKDFIVGTKAAFWRGYQFPNRYFCTCHNNRKAYPCQIPYE